MSVKELRKYINDTPSTREKIRLREFTLTHCENIGEKPELLCDFHPVVSWVLSTSDYYLIGSGKQSPYSLLYGCHFKKYGERLLSFVSAIRSFGLNLVFFIEGCTISDLHDDVLYENYLADWRKSVSQCASVLQACAGHCELSEVCWSFKEGLAGHLTSLLESADGVNVIYCDGKVFNEAVPYLQSNKNACGILTSDTSYAIVPEYALFLTDLFGLNMHQHPILPFGDNEDLHCEVVWSSLLAMSLGLEVKQLADLAILCGNYFSSTLNSKLKPWKTLGIADLSISTVAKWLLNQSTSLCKNNAIQVFLSENPCYKLAMERSYQVYMEECNLENTSCTEGDRLLACKKNGSSLSMNMISLVKHNLYLRPVLIEPDTALQPRFCDATLSIRKFIYVLMGLSRVTEVGLVSSTNVMCNREPLHIPVVLSWVRAGSDSEYFLRFSKCERLAILFHGVTSSWHFFEGCDQFNEFLLACVDDVEEFSCAKNPGVAAIIHSSLLFMKSSNSMLSPSAGISVCELEALLATCLTTLAGFPLDDYPGLPSAKAITTSCRFSHVIDQVYWLASCLCLSYSLPPQGDIFSSCAYIPFHHASCLNQEDADSVHVNRSGSICPQLKQLIAIYREVMELSPVKELRAEVLGKTNSTISRITELYTASVNAIASSRTLIDLTNHPAAGVEGDSNHEGKRKELVSPVPLTSEPQLDVDDTLSTSESMPSLGKSELSFSMECHVMEEDQYYSSQPVLQEGKCEVVCYDPLVSDDEGKEMEEEDEEEESREGELESSLKKDMILKVTVDSILNVSSDGGGEDVSDTLDSRGRKAVQVDCVLVNISDSPKSITSQNKDELLGRSEELPIMEHRSNILKLIRDHSVICIEGETGCGKSTKLPQFILDEALSQDEPTYCNIMVTQPRRVAAVKLAERVATERGEKVGKTVGYCVGGNHHRAPQTRLTYCTIGFFLQVRMLN